MKEFQDFVKRLSSPDRKKMILIYCKNPNKVVGETLLLDELVLFESLSILERKGEQFIVSSGKKDRRTHKMGSCYPNSSKMMKKGYDYVEGYVVNKKSGVINCHSWNVDKDGNHFDFTYDNPNEYDYFGVVIPESVVWNVGHKNGGIWYCVLPFVEDF
ncbi:MAG: hypothetical protein AB7S72_14730 [Draconibacterium sp.]